MVPVATPPQPTAMTVAVRIAPMLSVRESLAAPPAMAGSAPYRPRQRCGIQRLPLSASQATVSGARNRYIVE